MKKTAEKSTALVATDNPNQKTVSLINPIKRGDQVFEQITVTKPTIAALKGLKLMDVFSLEVDALRVMLPRVTQPMLHRADFEQMDVADFAELSAVAISFLGKNSMEQETETDAQFGTMEA